jgi:hypothetical protein
LLALLGLAVAPASAAFAVPEPATLLVIGDCPEAVTSVPAGATVVDTDVAAFQPLFDCWDAEMARVLADIRNRTAILPAAPDTGLEAQFVCVDGQTTRDTILKEIDKIVAKLVDVEAQLRVLRLAVRDAEAAADSWTARYVELARQLQEIELNGDRNLYTWVKNDREAGGGHWVKGSLRLALIKQRNAAIDLVLSLEASIRENSQKIERLEPQQKLLGEQLDFLQALLKKLGTGGQRCED